MPKKTNSLRKKIHKMLKNFWKKNVKKYWFLNTPARYWEVRLAIVVFSRFFFKNSWAFCEKKSAKSLKICKKKTSIFFRFYVMHFWVLSQAPKPENPPYPSPRDMPSPMSSPPSPVLCGNTLFDSDNPTAEESQNHWKTLALTAKPANPRTPPESKTTQLWLPAHFFFAAFFQKYFPVSCRLGFWGGAGVSVPERRFSQKGIPIIFTLKSTTFSVFWKNPSPS